MSDVDFFQHEPLANNNTLRIFELGSAQARPVDSVFHVSFGSCAYEAVSYVWGNPRHRTLTSVQQHGQARWLRIGENLEHVIETLRLPNKPRRLWIDAICINQDDIEERNRIVAQMLQIYRGAEKVLVCLGQEQRDSAYVNYAILAINQSLSGGGAANSLSDLDLQMRRVLSKHPDPHGHRQSREPGYVWESFRDFLSERGWFNRAWVVQEAAVARQSTVICGGWTIPGQAFFDTLGMLTNQPLPASIANIADNNDVNVDAALRQTRILQILGAGKSEVHQMKLIDLLASTRHLKSTDPRDKIYAMLGLASDGDLPAIDYSEPWQDTFQRFATYMINQGHLSSVLLNCFADVHSGDLPTWTPNWSTDEQSSYLSSHKLQIPYYQPGVRTVHYEAGGSNTPVSFIFPPDKPSTLSVKGYLTSVIVELSDRISPLVRDCGYAAHPAFEPLSPRIILEVLLEIRDFFVKDGHTDLQLIDRMSWITLFCNQHWGRNRPLEPNDWTTIHAFAHHWAISLDVDFESRFIKNSGDDQSNHNETPRTRDRHIAFKATLPNPADTINSSSPQQTTTRLEPSFRRKALNFFRTSMGSVGQVPLDTINSSSPQQTATRIKPSTNEFTTFQRKALNFCLGQLRCRTSMGSVGQVPLDTQIGDWVGVFDGVPVPMILRCSDSELTSDSTFKIIGPAFSVVLMNGDMVPELLRGESMWIALK